MSMEPQVSSHLLIKAAQTRISNRTAGNVGQQLLDVGAYGSNQNLGGHPNVTR